MYSSTILSPFHPPPIFKSYFDRPFSTPIEVELLLKV